MNSILKKINIHSKDDLKKLIIQFIKFGIVGASNTIIFLVVYYIFLFINERLYILGNALGFIVSVLNAYYWNDKYVFKKTSVGNVKPLIKTFVAYGGTFILSTLLLYIMVNYFAISKTIAPIINLIITIPINFLINKFWTFR